MIFGRQNGHDTNDVNGDDRGKEKNKKQMGDKLKGDMGYIFICLQTLKLCRCEQKRAMGRRKRIAFNFSIWNLCDIRQEYLGDWFEP